MRTFDAFSARGESRGSATGRECADCTHEKMDVQKTTQTGLHTNNNFIKMFFFPKNKEDKKQKQLFFG